MASTILRNGSKGSDVKKMQQALINAGYDVGSTGADGIFGANTLKAVKAYQKANGLTVDGIAGEKTLGSLYSTKSSSKSSSSSKSTLNGVDQDTLNKMNSQYQSSEKVTNAQQEASGLLDSYKELATTPFQESEAYKNAMAYTNQLLEQISSGRTSYTDQIKDLMGQIQNREDFSYDADTDPLFQQALASAMGDGKAAMQDTIGQASALTGGYGSTYATKAGNQAYNEHIQGAYDNLPEYYQMALNAYDMEGQEMYNQLAMLSDADAQEFQRMFESWGANFDNAQQMYQQDYSKWQDSVNNAYNAYAAVQGNADTLYAQEYQKWADEVANAMNYANILNSEYWNQKNYDESVRQYNESLALQKAQLAKSKSSGGSGSSGSSLKTPSETQMKKALEAYNSGGNDALYKYVDSLPSNIDVEAINTYVNKYGTWGKKSNTEKNKTTSNSISSAIASVIKAFK